MSKKVKNDEKGSDIDKTDKTWWKMKIIIFFGFFKKNMENVEKSEKWWEWVRYWWKRSKLMKNEKNNMFWIFQKNIEKCGKERKMMKMGKILMEKVKIDEKWKK